MRFIFPLLCAIVGVGLIVVSSSLENQTGLKIIGIVSGLILTVERLLKITKTIQELRPAHLKVTIRVINKRDKISRFRKSVLNQKLNEITGSFYSQEDVQKVKGIYPIICLMVDNPSDFTATITGIDIEATRLNNIYIHPPESKNDLLFHYLPVSHLYNVALDPLKSYQLVPVDYVSQVVSPKSSDRFCIVVGHDAYQENSEYQRHNYEALYSIMLKITYNKNNQHQTGEKLLEVSAVAEKPWKSSSLDKPPTKKFDSLIKQNNEESPFEEDYSDIKFIKYKLNNSSDNHLTKQQLESALKMINVIKRNRFKYNSLCRDFIDQEIELIMRQLELLKAESVNRQNNSIKKK